MGFTTQRKIRSRQVNVRLNSEDANEFRLIMERYRHQTVSDSVRDLIRNGYNQLTELKNSDIEKLLELAAKSEDEYNETKREQLNVRLNEDEVGMTDVLGARLRCYNISEVIRMLINIYYARNIKTEGGAGAR